CDPVSALSLERFWIHLPGRANARLPFYWDFGLRLIDVVGRPRPTGAAAGPARAQTAFFLGSAWCFVLLVNDRQAMQAVQAAVDRLPAGETDPENSVSAPPDLTDPVFAPNNLLFTPAVAAVDPEWEALWRRAVALGIDLLRQAGDPRAETDFSRLMAQTDQIRHEAHQLLFKAAPVSAIGATPEAVETFATADRDENTAIAGILKEVLAGWPQADVRAGEPRIETAGTGAEAQPQGGAHDLDGDGDFVETVILGKAPGLPEVTPDPSQSEDPVEQTVAPAPLEAAGQAGGWDDDMAPTVIISPLKPGTGDPPPAQAPEAWSAAALDRTVVIQPKRASAAGDADLERTVVISAPPATGDGANGVQPKPDDPSASAPSPKPDNDNGEDLAETVIIRPRNRKDGNRNP
ncbi:MAG: hypothetical protein HKP58_10440, partial [Desulfatitalea sp.]|nr:hypothetical protein [Desulfatitalea sp.]NNK00819.1 hypothetical protein [Desulfatitalea sp.]